VLNRAPDALGAANWLDAIANGLSTQSVAAALVASAEFQARGALSNAAFVSVIYENALGRAPDAEGLQAWTGALNSGARSRADVVVAIAESGEGQGYAAAATSAGLWTTNADAITVFTAYRVELDRAPDAAGLSAWMGALQNGMTTAQLYSAIAGSSEFQATFGPLNNTQRVVTLYEHAFEREPDAAGLAGHVAALNSGAITLPGLAASFGASAEMGSYLNSILDGGIFIA